ncbi:MAG: bifunctional 3-deoxy-7-phosphoheptulonate synthase/chorismate mutase [Candidatus Cyclobacteriaceae bacterium M3_2C_046]
MIIHLKKELTKEKAEELASTHQAAFFEKPDYYVLILSSKIKELPEALTPYSVAYFAMKSDIQLASREYQNKTRQINLGPYAIGGGTNHTAVITGPCSVESEEQITSSAELLKQFDLKILRAGCFKPRTSPYTFQGLGLEGLKLLDQIRKKYNLRIITEVRDASHVDQVISYADIVQIGAKAMYDHGILKKCGKAGKPILLKRGFGSTLQEFVQSAEFIMSGGNEQVVLCERGIRTFETKTRFTLDLCGVAYLKEYTNLPVVLDPSHAMGWAYGVADLTRACLAMGVDGLLIETHPDPTVAKSDASQQLDHQQFTSLYHSLPPVAQAIGKKIV